MVFLFRNDTDFVGTGKATFANRHIYFTFPRLIRPRLFNSFVGVEPCIRLYRELCTHFSDIFELSSNIQNAKFLGNQF